MRLTINPSCENTDISAYLEKGVHGDYISISGIKFQLKELSSISCEDTVKYKISSD